MDSALSSVDYLLNIPDDETPQEEENLQEEACEHNGDKEDDSQPNEIHYLSPEQSEQAFNHWQTFINQLSVPAVEQEQKPRRSTVSKYIYIPAPSPFHSIHSARTYTPPLEPSQFLSLGVGPEEPKPKRKYEANGLRLSKYPCAVPGCERIFATRKAVMGHYDEAHQGFRAHGCKCGKRFKRIHDFVRHVRVVHKSTAYAEFEMMNGEEIS